MMSRKVIKYGRSDQARCRWSVITSNLVRTQPVSIPGLAGPVVVSAGFFSLRYTVSVNGVDVRRTGRATYQLPAADGTMVEGKLRSGFFEPFPALQIHGVTYRTGPAVPLAVRILAVIPFLLFTVGGVLGAVLGAAGVVGNLAIARQSIPTAVKALSMVGVLIAVVVVWLVLAAAVTLAVK